MTFLKVHMSHAQPSDVVIVAVLFTTRLHFARELSELPRPHQLVQHFPPKLETGLAASREKSFWKVYETFVEHSERSQRPFWGACRDKDVLKTVRFRNG